MKISIQNRQKHILLNLKEVKKATRTILTDLGFLDAELSILLVDDTRVQDLNKCYLHRDKPTNVLAFPMREGEFSSLQPQLLGDIVISAETAARQSKKFGLTKKEMVLYFILHGILHLIGYAHEGTKKGAREMALKQKELFGNIIQPYKSKK